MTARSDYQTKQEELRVELFLLKSAIDHHALRSETNPTNYGYVGDIGYVLEQIIEINNFLGVETTRKKNSIEQ